MKKKKKEDFIVKKIKVPKDYTPSELHSNGEKAVIVFDKKKKNNSRHSVNYTKEKTKQGEKKC